jgi:hypothetical protein
MRLQKPNPCTARNLAEARLDLKASTLELRNSLPVILVELMRNTPDTLIGACAPSYKRINCLDESIAAS